ncbi:MAG: hypothetical protein H5U01_13140, partial [Clostridia bacterium]|nr:hypothetical protein [Clostridia bacterium]
MRRPCSLLPSPLPKAARRRCGIWPPPGAVGRASPRSARKRATARAKRCGARWKCLRLKRPLTRNLSPAARLSGARCAAKPSAPWASRLAGFCRAVLGSRRKTLGIVASQLFARARAQGRISREPKPGQSSINLTAEEETILAKRALISVSDKRGLEDLARGLKELGYELISTGGTARTLEGWGLSPVPVAAVTGFPEILEGRVKTPHP